MENNRSHLLTGLGLLILVILVFLAIAMIVPIRQQNRKMEEELLTLQQEHDQSKIELQRLNREINALKSSPEAIAKVAREKFGLCQENETILRYDEKAPSDAEAVRK
ncbi:MAG: cell division protein FtsL [Victivallaceae bacterium]